MFDNFCLKALLLAGIVLPFTGCGTSSGLDSITVTPPSASDSLTAGGSTLQLTATGVFGNGSHPSFENITDQVTWTSSSTGVATVGSSTGLVTPVAAGTTTVTATAAGFGGPVTGSVTVTVTLPAGSSAGAGAEGLLSIQIIPSLITDLDLFGNAQFLAYGTFSSPPTVMDVTNGVNHNGFVSPVTWISDAPYDFPVETGGAPGAVGGLVTAWGSGGANIYATAANPDGTLVQSTISTFNCPYAPPTYATVTNPITGVSTTTMTNIGTCNEYTIGDSLLSTLTVFNTGLNQTNWEITAPSATGTPDNVIHCGPSTLAGGSVCEAAYPIGSSITLTETSTPASSFGGWSANCGYTDPNTGFFTPEPLIPTCTITLGGGCAVNKNTGTSVCDNYSNVSVGAVFN
jgi:hypothetical protein